MDPDVLLAAIRAHAWQVLACADTEQDLDVGEVVRLAEAALALDEWLSRGGFAPGAWCRLDGSLPSVQTTTDDADKSSSPVPGSPTGAGR